MKKENPYLNLYLGEWKEPWVSHCKSLDQKPGSILKEFVQNELEGVPEPHLFQQTKEVLREEDKQRFEVLLTASEKAALEQQSRLERCSQRQWVIDAIRVGLTKQPQFSMKEIEMLGESNYQLLAIGRNLNQIAKAINQGLQDSVEMEFIYQLREIIDAHTEKVNQALRASLERWTLE